MSDELTWKDATALARDIRERRVSPTEVMTAVLDQLQLVEPHINAFVTTNADAAMDRAKTAEQELYRRPAAELPPLFGVPITVKDLTDTAGVRTTYGSAAHADHIPAEDGINWARLRSAGALLVGKTTTPEFGGLGVTHSGLTGITNNPWRLTHTAGGSSGGAAASLAAGVAPIAWGSDGGGSIRVPAACCGVVGLKASRGRIPVDRPWESVGIEGPLTRTVRDAALLLDVTSGPHPMDPLALESPRFSFAAALQQEVSLKGVRIAFAPAPAGANVDVEVTRIVRRAVDQISGSGAHVTEVDLDVPDPVQYFEDYWSPGFVDREAGDATEFPLHPAMMDFAAKGRAITAVDYLHTSTVIRGEITAAFARVFAKNDLIVMPTMPVPAFPHPGDEAGPTQINGVPVRRPAIEFHRFTESPSHAGLPAITVPCGFSENGLPIGLQIVGPMFADGAVLLAAAAFESIMPWIHTRPQFAA